jgi:hypothetical protein
MRNKVIILLRPLCFLALVLFFSILVSSAGVAETPQISSLNRGPRIHLVDVSCKSGDLLGRGLFRSSSWRTYHDRSSR